MLTKYFGDRPFWRDVVRLGLPIALQNLLASSLSLVDTVMIGQLGEESISAVGMAGQWSWLMTVVFFGFTSGAAVFISQYWGVKNVDGIRRSYGVMLLFTMLTAIAFMLIAVFAPGFVVGLFTKDENVLRLGMEYLSLAAWSYPALALTNTFSTTLRSTENVKLPMYVGFLTVISNAVLNYIFMFELDMHIAGAALGTVIAAWISPICLFFVFPRDIFLPNTKKLPGPK